MINEVTIKNFKSVQNTNLKLGRFNVLIGSNGSGKSNILEAIAFGAAASADKLDNEFFGSRGMRSSSSNQMISAFEHSIKNIPIIIQFKINNENYNFTIEGIENPILEWNVKEKKQIDDSLMSEFFNELFKVVKLLRSDELKKLEGFDIKEVNKLESEIRSFQNRDKNELNKTLKEGNYFNLLSIKKELDKFIIFAPEESSLRKFETESQIKPLGIKGEGLFDVLQIFNESYGKETIEEIKNYLHLIEWFDDFEAVSDQVTGRKSLVIKDRYLPDARLNQTNVNEGFLYLLFYISLFVSKETPTFFAIDNIEASFHPTLVEELIRNLIELSKRHNKQIIITTHNPFVLDGLNLDDEEQKLFVIRRNADGETIADPISNPSKRIKLSEAWIRGQFGGQPKNIR